MINIFWGLGTNSKMIYQGEEQLLALVSQLPIQTEVTAFPFILSEP